VIREASKLSLEILFAFSKVSSHVFPLTIIRVAFEETKILSRILSVFIDSLLIELISDHEYSPFLGGAIPKISFAPLPFSFPFSF